MIAIFRITPSTYHIVRTIPVMFNLQCNLITRSINGELLDIYDTVPVPSSSEASRRLQSSAYLKALEGDILLVLVENVRARTRSNLGRGGLPLPIGRIDSPGVSPRRPPRATGAFAQ